METLSDGLALATNTVDSLCSQQLSPDGIGAAMLRTTEVDVRSSYWLLVLVSWAACSWSWWMCSLDVDELEIVLEVGELEVVLDVDELEVVLD
eukprot:6491430-Amphidinium_carterae.1